MVKHDIEAARELLIVDLDKLPVKLKRATEAQIGLAQQGLIRHVIKTTLQKLTEDEGYRYELIVKEMSGRGFINFGGCLSDLSKDELDNIIDYLSLQLKPTLETHINGTTKRLP